MPATQETATPRLTNQRQNLEFRQETYEERQKRIQEMLFCYATRENLPEMMRRLPPRPNRKEGLLAWKAHRDELLRFADIHGYIIGALTAIAWNTDISWGFVAEGELWGRRITYHVGGLVRKIGELPECGQTVLLTRGFASEDLRKDNQPRPYDPIPSWFLATS